MRVPPIKSDQGPVGVAVSIDLLKLVDIDEEDYSIEIQFGIKMNWKENRATYHNLKKKDSLNAFPEKDFRMLWLPRVIDETEIFKGEENSLVMIQTYTHTFQCNYQLSTYPFDTQVNHCSYLVHSFVCRLASSTWRWDLWTRKL